MTPDHGGAETSRPGIPFFQVDAFTTTRFGGNPAAVCLLDRWLPDTLLGSIAAENNLSETAFVVAVGDEFELRWFTPQVEVELCGHATLATAHVLFATRARDRTRLVFRSKSGTLEVTRAGDRLVLDFPARVATPFPSSPALEAALGASPQEVLKADDLLVVFEESRQLEALTPDFTMLLALDGVRGVIVTAPGEGVDFVSRFFAPAVGIPEDPVTGSAHCTLVPYWAQRFGKSALHARQLSARGGELFCELAGDRVFIAGQAVLYAAGEIYV